MVKVLVFSATGRQGNALAHALLSSKKQQHSVRAYVRDASTAKAKALAAAGAEIFVGGDWDKDVASVEKATEGVDAVFFISNLFLDDLEVEVRSARNIVEAARRAGVRHVLYSTVAGLEKWGGLEGSGEEPPQKANGEKLVKNAGFPHYTLLRPTEFMTNYTEEAGARFCVPELTRTGVWRTPIPGDFELAVVDPEDIGRAAAAAIESPDGFGGPTRTLEIAGERVRVADVVALLAAAAGRDLRMETMPLEEARAAAETNPSIAAELVRLELVDGRSFAVDHFGLGFRSFKDHVALNKERIAEVYKNVP
ncbi:hypothetical protein M426DRAFT_8943 [Hypoxylon sp. CI-4A]|nr:hypothetical protein M426DRAFT_8943 [Hypoxylon sp. CI-4A]